MAEITRTYSGPLARVRVNLNGRDVRFQRGTPTVVTAEDAALLDGDPDWADAKKTPPTKDDAPTTKGSKPDPKES